MLYVAQANPSISQPLSVTVEGTYEGRVFDERELKFEIGDGDSLGLPPGVEKAIMAMEQGEEAFFNIKPKYDHIYQSKHCFILMMYLIVWTIC